LGILTRNLSKDQLILDESAYVSGNGNGGHIGDMKHSFTSACRKAGLTHFRFHDLWHTYASHLAMRGVHIRALQELLGHKTLAMTQRYSHLAPEQLQNAVKLLDGVIGEKRELKAQAIQPWLFSWSYPNHKITRKTG
jgi:integrase